MLTSRIEIIAAQKLAIRKSGSFVLDGVVYKKHPAYLEAKEGAK